MPQLTLPILPLGPLIDLIVTVSNPRQIALNAAKQPIPPPVQARFLIDTGASGTCVDVSVISALGLSPTGIIQVHTPSTQGVPAQMQQYDVGIVIPHPVLSRHFAAVPVTEGVFKPQGIDGLLGRDILSDLLLVYSGPDKAYIVTI